MRRRIGILHGWGNLNLSFQPASVKKTRACRRAALCKSGYFFGKVIG